jgi:hypothetical protein
MTRIALALLLLIGSAQARDLGQWNDPDLKRWYEALMQPDNPKASCCGESDAYFCDELGVRAGKPSCVITDDREDAPRRRPHVDIGTVIQIPEHKLMREGGNPTGHGVVFMSPGQYVFCYVQGGGV